MNTASSDRSARRALGRRGFKTWIARGTARALRIPLTIAATRVLQGRLRTVSSLEDALDLAYDFSLGGITLIPWQERAEITGFLELVAAEEPERVLEIGTSNGGSLFLFARAAAPDAVLVSIDLPGGEFGGGYSIWRSRLYRSFALGRQRITLLRADSHDAATLEAAQKAFNGEKVDVLFIDGDHSYDGVKLDFEMYRPLVREGGIIAFHDIVPPCPGGPTPRNDDDLQAGEVPRFWAELRTAYETTEYVDDWNSGRFGIGAIRMRS